MLEKKLFDGDAMIAVLDARRAQSGLDWNGLANELYEQSSVLNAELNDNCMCSGALVRTAKRGTMSCQYALIILRWIGRSPEDFLKTSKDVGETRLLRQRHPGGQLTVLVGSILSALKPTIDVTR